MFKKINNFFMSIDTITTKLLFLVLCCVTIPLVVVGSFSTNIINQSIIENSQITISAVNDNVKAISIIAVISLLVAITSIF